MLVCWLIQHQIHFNMVRNISLSVHIFIPTLNILMCVRKSTFFVFLLNTAWLTQSSTAVRIYYLFSTSVVTIGFNATYFVHEDARGVSVVVLVLMNSLGRDVVVTLSILDDTARGRFAQCLTCLDKH